MNDQIPLIDDPLLGYISVLKDGDKYRGALLVVNPDGDPVDFTHSGPVSIDWPMVHLLGSRVAGYVTTELIAPPLLATAKRKPSLVCFHEAGVLTRNVDVGVPVVVWAPADARVNGSRWQRVGVAEPAAGDVWWGQAETLETAQSFLELADRSMAPDDITEPFSRLRNALELATPVLPR